MKETKIVRKPLEEMNVIDNFLFTEMMSDEEDGREVCKIILSTVLKREIGEISFTPQKVVQGVTETSHGIMMDAFIKERTASEGREDEVNVYDIEPDKRKNKKEGLPRRSRYYGDLTDSKLLETGTDYENMPDLVTIFILSYDPFGKNAMYYEAGSVLKTHPGVPYNDGIRRIYLYVDGELPEKAGDDERRIKNLMTYIGESTETNVTDETTRRLNEIVKRTKAKKDVGVRYMKSWEWERDIREEGMEEGREEGRNEGREEERANTEIERRRADAAELRAKEAEDHAKEAEDHAREAIAELERYKEKYGELVEA